MDADPPSSRTPAPDPRDPSGRPAPPPLVIGVLGGIASGKSAVAHGLAGPEGEVVSADAIAHEVLEDPGVLARLREHFGPGIFGPDGRVERPRLAERVFDPVEGPGNRRRLEGWTHPLVRDRIWARLEAARAAGRPRVVLDVPLLLENDAQHGLARACHVLVFVEVDAATRDRRARERRGWPEGDVARREKAQLPLEEKRALADHSIPNHGSLEDLEQALAELDRRLA